MKVEIEAGAPKAHNQDDFGGGFASTTSVTLAFGHKSNSAPFNAIIHPDLPIGVLPRQIGHGRARWDADPAS